jgi:FkbM family methyltransferase
MLFKSTSQIYLPRDGPPFRLSYRGLRIECPWHNLGGFYSIGFGGTYDPILSRIGPRDVVLDGGANVGVFSLLASRRARRVIAIEPDPLNFVFLVENIKRNGITNVVPINAALWDTAGTIHFKGIGEVGQVSATGDMEVRTIMLDSLRDETVSVMKLDIEGAEPTILLGFSGMETVHTLVYERDGPALDRLNGDIAKGRAALPNYDQLATHLRIAGFTLSYYGRGETRLLHKVIDGDLLRSELRTRLFGVRFGLSALLVNHENVLKPNYGADFCIVYAMKVPRGGSSSTNVGVPALDGRVQLESGKRQHLRRYIRAGEPPALGSRAIPPRGAKCGETLRWKAFSEYFSSVIKGDDSQRQRRTARSDSHGSP